MTDATLWLTMVGMGIITYSLRISLIALLERWQLPAWFERAVRFVPAAVLSALVVPALIAPVEAPTLLAAHVRLWAGVVAALAAYYSRSLLLTLAVGMTALWLLQALL